MEGKAPDIVYGGIQKYLDIGNSMRHILGNRFRVIHRIGKKKLALQHYEGELLLLKDCGLNIGKSKVHNTSRGSKIYSALLAGYLDEVDKELLGRARFISICADGSMCHGHNANECVRVRMSSTDEGIVDMFVGISRLIHEDAKGTLKGIKEALESLGIDEEFLKAKGACVSLDGASVNMGVNSSVAKDLVDIYTWLVVSHCVCHNLELMILDTKDTMDYMKDLEFVVKAIYKMYHYSAKRRNEFEVLCVAADEECKQFGGIQTIRWAASQLRALEAILNNWKITVEHLNQIAASKDENAAYAKGLRDQMLSLKFLRHLHFMLDFLTPLRTLSLKFQKHRITVMEVVSELESCKECLKRIKNGNGPFMKAFEATLQYNADGLPVWRDTVLNKRAYNLRRQQTLDEIWLLPSQRPRTAAGKRSRRSMADGEALIYDEDGNLRLNGGAPTGARLKKRKKHHMQNQSSPSLSLQ